MQQTSSSKKSLDTNAILVAVILGFSAAFLLCLGGVYFLSTTADFRAQLVAGDPGINSEYPTTRSILGQSNEVSVMVESLANFWFWCAVFLGGFFGTLYIMRRVRGAGEL